MKREDIINDLPLIDIDSKNVIWMSLYECFISIDDFIDRFGESDLNYESLSNNKNTDADWLNQFKDWKEKGILN